MTTTGETFESLVNEFREASRGMIGEEVHEGYPLDVGLYSGTRQPYDSSGPPFKSPWILTEKVAKAYAVHIGDDNPLYTDPEYAKNGPYGCLTTPGTAMIMARTPMWHGPEELWRDRPGGIPFANFHSGTAWEFYDVLRVGTGLRTTSKAMEVIEKPGAQGNLFFLITDVFYWDMRGDLLGKCYGTLIMIPREEMGTGRAMSVERLGERMMYERQAGQYNQEKVEELIDLIEKAEPRGKEILYWEDVNEGDKLPTFIIPPWTDQDWTATGFIRNGPGRGYQFEGGYQMRRHIRHEGPGGFAYTHPVSRWPWGAADEHGDPLMAAYRGQALPFDWGGQRSQIPQALMSNWMGDHGFIRRLQMALRRPFYYSDIGLYNGTVTKKFTEVQKGEPGEGAVDGERTYYAVGIKYEGRNQEDQVFVQGTSTVYLPSREGGMVQLPIPHVAKPPAIPYETFYRDWY
jgi:acyl dehydratase